MSKELIINPTLALAWSRLQHISCAHASLIHRDRYQNSGKYHKDRYSHKVDCTVPETIRENVEILGRGDEEEIKARLFWYADYYPELWVDAIAAKG